MSGRSWLFFLVPWLLLWSLRPARALGQAPAAAPRARLTYAVAADLECPDQGAVQARVAALLGYDPFAEPASVLAAVAISQASGGLQAALHLTTDQGVARGQQTLSSAEGDCTELAAAVELALGLAIDPASLRRRKPARSLEAEAPQASASAAPPAPPPPPPASAPALPVFSLLAGALGAFGAAPSPNVGFQLGFEARWPRLSLGLEGRADLPAGGSFGGGSVAAALTTGALVTCFRIGPGGLCGLVAAGSEQAVGSGFATDAEGSTPYLAVGARALEEIPIYRACFARLQIDLRAPFTRTEATASGQPLWTSAALEADLAAVLGLRL